jgi:hypothetical protein
MRNLSPVALRITPFDNFVYLYTSRTLEKYAKFAALKLEVSRACSSHRSGS